MEEYISRVYRTKMKNWGILIDLKTSNGSIKVNMNDHDDGCKVSAKLH